MVYDKILNIMEYKLKPHICRIPVTKMISVRTSRRGSLYTAGRKVNITISETSMEVSQKSTLSPSNLTSCCMSIRKLSKSCLVSFRVTKGIQLNARMDEADNGFSH